VHIIGTHYMWEMLQRLQIDVHHEGVGPDGAVSWLYAVKYVLFLYIVVLLLPYTTECIYSRQALLLFCYWVL